METIFDHNVTAEEYKIIAGSVSKEDYLWLNDEQEDHYGDLVHLYYLRNDPVNARKYYNKITDPMYKDSLLRSLFHP